MPPALRDEPGRFAGNFDGSAVAYPGVRLLWGWAVDNAGRLDEIEIVVIDRRGRLAAKTTTRIHRQDVVDALDRDGCDRAGWRVSIPTALFEPGPQPLRTYALDPDAKCACYIGAVEIDVPAAAS